MANLDAGLDPMSTEDPVHFDIEQAHAYTAMSPEEFARSWTLECVTSNALSTETPKHDKGCPSSSDEDDDIASVHTIMCGSPPMLPQPMLLSNDEAPPQQQKSSRPPRQLRPRRTIQLLPFTIERAQYKALVHRADYDELLRATPYPQQRRRSSSYRDRSPSVMDEYIMTQGNDGEYEYDEEDEVATATGTQDDDDEEIMTQQMHQMKMTFQPFQDEQHHQDQSTSFAAGPFGAKSLWPRMPKASPLHTYSKKRKRGDAQERHRRRRRPPPRIADEAENEDYAGDGGDDDANSLDSTLLAADPLQGQGIAWDRAAATTTTTTTRSEDRYDVFAFPSMPSSHTNVQGGMSSSAASQDVLTFPVNGPSTQLPFAASSSRSTRPVMEHHRRPRKPKENDLDGFVIDDTYDPPSKKKSRCRGVDISTKGVLPYSFVRVGHRVTEPKRIVFEDLSDDEEDRKSTSSKSDAEQEQNEGVRRSSFSSTQQGKLPAFFDHRATPRRAVSLSPPPQSRHQVPRHPVAKAPTSSRHNKLSLSRKKKSSREPSNVQQHQHPQRRPRRPRDNKQHGIYILPGPSSPERHPYFTTAFRPRERSPIIFPSPNRDQIQADDTLDSYWWPGLSASPLASSSPPALCDNAIPVMALDRQPLLPTEDETLSRFIESNQPFSVDFGALPDTRHGHGHFSASLYLNRDLFKNGTYQIPTHLLNQDLTLGEDMTVGHNTLRRLFYKCFRDLADHMEGRRDEGAHQELEMHNMVTFFYFISSSLRITPLPDYYEKEILCFLGRVHMLIETKACLGCRQLPVVLMYAMDWLDHLGSPPPLDMVDTETQLLKTLYQLGPDVAHVAREEKEATGTMVPKDAIALEAWIFLLRRSSCETVWEQMMQWLGHEALALHARVEKTWHWLFVLRVLLGFDKEGEWHGLGDPQRMATLSGVPKLLDDTQWLCSRVGPLYGDYSECLSQRQVRLLEK